MNPPRHIPREIVGVIIHHAQNDRGTLYNLCLVSRSFLPEAQRILYREIIISNDNPPVCSGWFISTTSATQLLTTLTGHNTPLAELVWSFYHHYVHPNDLDDGSHYWNLVKRSLRLMVNLKKLTIFGADPIADFFEGCSFDLKAFGYDGEGGNPELFYDTMLQLLSGQSNLESLYIPRWICDHKALPNTCCPRLKALTGGRLTIENILPGRPVTRLTWVPNMVENLYTLPSTIISKLSSICVLVLGGYYERPSLRLFFPYLASLQVLRLVGKAPAVSMLFMPANFTRANLNVMSFRSTFLLILASFLIFRVSECSYGLPASQ